MLDIYATDLIYEQCAREKEKIDMVIPYAVLHFVVNGEGIINGQKVGKNTLFASFENNRMQYSPIKESPWSYIYLRLSGSEIEKAFAQCGFSKGLTILPFEDQEALFQLLSFYQKIQKDDPAAQKIIANAIFLLFKTPKKETRQKSKAEQHMEKIQQYIDEHYYRNLKMEELAHRFFLHKNYIRTLFDRYLGLSPKEYIQKVRMERAKFLLRSTEESIKVIAASCGYKDPLLFSKMFCKYFGISPSQYRKK